MASILAAADIGSNTAHLLVAATDGQLVMRVDNVNEWIPLGETVARLGYIPADRIEELVAAVKEFKKVATSKSAKSLYVFATEAMRAADNHQGVLKRIKQETGVSVQIVDPRREAEFSSFGIGLDTEQLETELMFEVGGGSAQVAVLHQGVMQDEASLPLGTGRLIAEAGLINPCPADALLAAEHYIAKVLDDCPLSIQGTVAVACGGVARGLWRALHPDGEKQLDLEEIGYLAWATSRLPVVRVSERFNVKAKRAGTLLPGALIYSALLRKFGCRTMTLSEFGVREGAILEMARGNVKGMSL